jgi:hypothetical protein
MSRREIERNFADLDPDVHDELKSTGGRGRRAALRRGAASVGTSVSG